LFSLSTPRPNPAGEPQRPPGTGRDVFSPPLGSPRPFQQHSRGPWGRAHALPRVGLRGGDGAAEGLCGTEGRFGVMVRKAQGTSGRGWACRHLRLCWRGGPGAPKLRGSWPGPCPADGATSLLQSPAAALPGPEGKLCPPGPLPRGSRTPSLAQPPGPPRP
uniref:Uncharacterized protein n=1 Tax=Anser brachyrhynchus TaxID=132585 RepID=A0A8B9CT34_9AVES